LLVVALTALVRLPFLGSLGPDEGGYAYIAHRWAEGASLYRGVWIDRPQGLIALYRVLLDLGRAPVSVRIGAIVLSCVTVLMLLVAGTALHSTRAGVLAATMFALAGVGPHLEGFTLNGELAAAAPAAAAVAVAIVARRSGSRRWLFVAGLLAGGALTMKQAGIDGLAVALLLAAGAAPARGRAIAAVLAGTAVPVGLCAALATATTGMASYWNALGGYELGQHSLGSQLATRAHELVTHAGWPARDLAPVAVAALVGTAVSRARHRLAVPACWVGAAAVCVNIGGAYWPHYFVQLLAPLSLAAGVAIASTGRRWMAWVAVALVGLLPLVYVTRVVTVPDAHADVLVPYAQGYDIDVRVATWLRRHTRPAATIYVLSSRADVYFLADRRSAFPYIWGRPLRAIPGAQDVLARVLAGPRGPRFVAEYQRPAGLDGGRIRRILERLYRLRWHTPGWAVRVFEARPRAAAAP
jgi:hypothetical protein